MIKLYHLISKIGGIGAEDVCPVSFSDAPFVGVLQFYVCGCVFNYACKRLN